MKIRDKGIDDFLSFYKNRLNLIDDQNPIKVIFQKKKVDTSVPLSLMRECENLSIKKPQDFLVFCQKLLKFVLIFPFACLQRDTYLPSIKNLFQKGIKEGYWSSFQLPKASIALSYYLMMGIYKTCEVVQLKGGGVLLESGNHISDGSVIRPIESTYLALIWLYLGWANQDERLLHAGLKLAQFCMNFCDKEGYVFQGLWTKESEYHSSTLYAALFLLCSAISCSSFNIATPVTQEVWAARLATESIEQIDLFIPLLAMKFKKLVEKKPFHHVVSSDFLLHDMDRSLGFLCYDYQTLRLACSACGVNTGLGVFHKKGVDIVTFGPHFYPLFDSNYFGIYRTSNGSEGGFQDIMMQREGKGCRLRGCSPLVSPLLSDLSEQNFSRMRLGMQWMFFDICVKQESIDIEIKLNKCMHEYPLAFVFFVAADRVVMKEEKVLLPRSLKRYQGKTTMLTFEKGEEKNIFFPNFEGNMEVIPLEGKHHFWSASFLIAFPLTKALEAYSWSF